MLHGERMEHIPSAEIHLAVRVVVNLPLSPAITAAHAGNLVRAAIGVGIRDDLWPGAVRSIDVTLIPE
ncbi:MAG: hypothetical protein NVSMB64_18850 [Candidatus Velthaea sp.]